MKAAKEEQKKIYQARKFAKGAMVCPACRYVLDKPFERCPKCRFSGEVAVKKFPFAAPDLAPVIDPSSILTKQEQDVLRAKIAKIAKRLPQVRFFNCLVELGEDVDLREFGFWLFNAAKLEEGEEWKSFGILFLVDPKAKGLSVTVGYGFDALLKDPDWEEICRKVRGLFARQKYLQGIEAFLDEAQNLLIETALKLAQEVKGK